MDDQFPSSVFEDENNNHNDDNGSSNDKDNNYASHHTSHHGHITASNRLTGTLSISQTRDLHLTSSIHFNQYILYRNESTGLDPILYLHKESRISQCGTECDRCTGFREATKDGGSDECVWKPTVTVTLYFIDKCVCYCFYSSILLLQKLEYKQVLLNLTMS